MKEEKEKMPVLFIGHGNPMNAITSNHFTRSLENIGKNMTSKIKAIMVVSAHWLTKGTFVNVVEKPEIIYDFYGFPKELYQVRYPVMGAPIEAKEVANLASEIIENDKWGLDHGSWAILKHIFPKADIPVFQLSINYDRPMQYHFDLAQKLKGLRENGVLVIGSGNLVHNLSLAFRSKDDAPYDWAMEFDEIVKNNIVNRDFDSLIHYEKFGRAAELSIPTVDHYFPLLYSLGLAEEKDDISFFYEEVFSSISMRCLKIG